MSQMCKVNRENLRALVKAKELKQWWLAEQAGIHKTTLRRWLSGKIDRAHTIKMKHLADVLQANASDLTVS